MEAHATNTGSAQEVLAWQDDPVSGLDPIVRPVPSLDAGSLSIDISGPDVEPKQYSPGTSEFRYWTAAEALGRGIAFWRQILPDGTTWTRGSPLTVNLDKGVDLNAYYNRQSLSFFHQAVRGQTVYSGESADVVCHELGHAVLDAIRPQLWDVMSIEVAAFHESFGDMSALLCALQLQSVRVDVLVQTSGALYQSSPLSLMAEQLGWGIHQLFPDATDPDCLRNAVNSFFYQDPQKLPPRAPAATLSSEPHSFSRVFTAGFFRALGRMLKVQGGSAPTEQDLAKVAVDMARLLVLAVAEAPVVPAYYSQVAAHLVAADTTLFSGRYREALVNAFGGRGILSVDSMSATPGVPAAAEPAFAFAETDLGAGEALPLLAVPGERYGLGSRILTFQAPVETRRFQVTGAAPDLGSIEPPTAQRAAAVFIEDLFRRGKVDVGEYAPESTAMRPAARQSHKVIEQDGALRLARDYFDCTSG